MRRTRILTSKRTADQQEEEKLTTQSNNLTNSSDVDAWKLWLEEKQKRLQEEKEKARPFLHQLKNLFFFGMLRSLVIHNRQSWKSKVFFKN